jgi:hypothetical protein
MHTQPSPRQREKWARMLLSCPRLSYCRQPTERGRCQECLL